MKAHSGGTDPGPPDRTTVIIDTPSTLPSKTVRKSVQNIAKNIPHTLVHVVDKEGEKKVKENSKRSQECVRRPLLLPKTHTPNVTTGELPPCERKRTDEPALPPCQNFFPGGSEENSKSCHPSKKKPCLNINVGKKHEIECIPPKTTCNRVL